MFNLFKKDKPSIDSISIPNFGWGITKEEHSIKQWINSDQSMALTINFFDLAPDLPSLQNIDKLRNYYREQIANANGGLIQVDLIEIDGFNIIKTIFKVQQEESGITYLTSLTIPFNSCSYVIKIQAPEIGDTGMRESLIADQLLKEGIINIDESGYTGWSNDPYLEDFSKGLPMNLSESLKYDKDFPKHPLSITRNLISQIEVEIELRNPLKKIKQFK